MVRHITESIELESGFSFIVKYYCDRCDDEVDEDDQFIHKLVCKNQ